MGPAGEAPVDSAPGSGVVFVRREKILVATVYAGIVVATAFAFAAVGLFGRTWPIFLGIGPFAFILGLRHGVDADHISAIDNTTRKLLAEDQRPLTVGTWFSLGHSTIVIALIVALVLAVEAVARAIPVIAAAGTLIGTAVSGGFLYIIGLLNLVIAIEIYRIFRGLRSGRLDARGLDEQLNKRGFMARYFGRLFRIVNRPYQMYAVGLLFGLGFDTATEVALITLAVTTAKSVPLWAILVLPLLFTVGMVLVDTTDGIMMRFAYGWAFLRPIRKIYYNLTITVISVLVAFGIGTLEVLGVVANALGLTGGAWSFVDFVNGEQAWELVGFVIVGLFAVAWLVSLAVYRYKHYEEIGFGSTLAPEPSEPVPRAEP
jgi:nickel/cobalt transporter (NiCoT) family protein